MKPLIISLAALALCVALTGCATDIPPATALADGSLTTAPAGWTNYCERHSEDPACRL